MSIKGTSFRKKKVKYKNSITESRVRLELSDAEIASILEIDVRSWQKYLTKHPEYNHYNIWTQFWNIVELLENKKKRPQ